MTDVSSPNNSIPLTSSVTFAEEVYEDPSVGSRRGSAPGAIDRFGHVNHRLSDGEQKITRSHSSAGLLDSLQASMRNSRARGSVHGSLRGSTQESSLNAKSQTV